MCGSLSITIGEVKSRASELAVYQICVNHEAMNGCSLKDCFENVNIAIYERTIFGYIDGVPWSFAHLHIKGERVGERLRMLRLFHRC